MVWVVHYGKDVAARRMKDGEEWHVPLALQPRNNGAEACYVKDKGHQAQE